jgi:hypothetical protein
MCCQATGEERIAISGILDKYKIQGGSFMAGSLTKVTHGFVITII